MESNCKLVEKQYPGMGLQSAASWGGDGRILPAFETDTVRDGMNLHNLNLIKPTHHSALSSKTLWCGCPGLH